MIYKDYSAMLNLHRNQIISIGELMQYDKDSNRLKIALYNGSAPFDLSSVDDIICTIVKPDGTTVQYAKGVDSNPSIDSVSEGETQNAITVVLSDQALTQMGTCTGSITVVQGVSPNETYVSFPNFSYDVIENVYTDSGTPSADEFPNWDTHISDLASTATGKGASMVGVEDSSGDFDATDVETALAELKQDIVDVTLGQIPDGSLANAKLANMSTSRIKGRVTAETGVPEDLTPTQALSVLGITATSAEINVLDGIPGTLTATEVGYLDGVTSAIQTQIDNIPGNTATYTNKRVNPRVVTATDDATAVIDTDVTDQYQLTAIANATAFSTTGTPVNGQKLVIRLKDAGVSKALDWTTGANFNAVGVTLLTATTAGKTHYIGCMYNSANSKWDVIAVSKEA